MKKISFSVLLFLMTAILCPLHAAEIPFAQFNAAKGAVQMELTLTDKQPEQQYIFCIYSSKGDVFNLLYRKNRLQTAFYDRSAKKWYHTQSPRPLTPNKKSAVTMTWELPGKVSLTIDGKNAGMMTVPEAPNFAQNTKFFVQSNQINKDGFKGKIDNLKFGTAAAAPAKSALPAAAVKGDVRAEYVFELTIDEPLKDLSGNAFHPENTPGESSFVKGELDAIRFAKDGDGIKLPFAAFPGARGALEAIVKLEQKSVPINYIFSCYSAKGDGFHLSYRKNRLHFGFYDRSAKKWYNAANIRPLPLNKFVKINLTWELPGEVKLYINDRPAGSVKVDTVPDFTADSLLFIGSSYQKKSVFQGMIHSVKLLNTPEIPAAKTPVKKTSNKRVTIKAGAMTLAFDTVSLLIKSWQCDGVEYVSDTRDIPAWLLRLYDKTTGKYINLSADDAARSSFRTGQDEIKLFWHDVALPDGSKTDVCATVSASGTKELNWQINTGILPEKYGVDSLTFPRIPCRPTAKNPREMFLCYPKYYGINIPDAFALKSGQERRLGSSYPGGAHWQFAYLYGKNVPGVYLHADDASGNYKEFLFNSHPQEKTLVLAVNQTPRQRAVSRQFVQQYPIRSAIIPGDWYDAAKHYRKWAEQQPWSAIGTLDKRTDLPQWIYDLHIATRHSTFTPNYSDLERSVQRVKINVDNVRTAKKLLNTAGLGVWYSYGYVPAGTPSTFHGAGQFNARPELQTIPGVPEAVAEFRKNNIYTIGYLNTRIYDQPGVPGHADSKAVEPLVMRYLDGTFQLYANKSFDVCRIAPGWQQRLLEIIKKDAVKNGFAGMYLDSFGRGQPHCWAANHGHEPGSTTASVTGQRVLAKLIRTEMRKLIPDFVISSEANIEQFVDVIDFKLHHENIYEHAVPVWTKIYHDRQFVYGRNTNYPGVQITSCFHIGAFLGRIFMGDSDEKLHRVYLTEKFTPYYRKLIAMRKHFYKQIGIGEMLRPPVVKCELPPTKEKIGKNKIDYPAVNASAWRNTAGTPAAFFTNHTDQKAVFTFTLDPQEFPGKPRHWLIADNDGNLHKQPFNTQTLELPPQGVAALEF